MVVSFVQVFSLLLVISTFVSTQNVFPVVPFTLPFPSTFSQPGSYQFPPPVSQTQITNKLGRIGLFTDVFYKAVLNSPQLLQVFDISYSPIEASKNIFQACKEALSSAGIDNFESLSKSVADSLYMTIPFMDQRDFVYTLSDAVATYLVTQSQLTPDNTPSFATDFAGAILDNYPNAGDQVNHYTLIRSFTYGVVAFLQSKGAYPLDRAPALSLEISKHFFAMSTVRQPVFEVTVVAPPGTIPSAFNVFGINGFARAFLDAVNSSPLLQTLFFIEQPGSIVGQAWNDAIDRFCNLINCYYPIATSNVIQEAVNLTYDYMSKRTFTLCVARAYALTLFAIGKTTPQNAESDAQTVTTTIQNNLSQLPPNADLPSRVYAYFDALKSITGNDADLVFQFPMHMYHISNELYADSNTKKKRYSYDL